MVPAIRIARVLPNVTGLDREFDYLVPPTLGPLAVGDLVRVVLHGRRIEGWIVSFPESSAVETSKLLSIESRLGHGSSAEILELARWAARRWLGRMRPLLVASSPSRRTPRVPAPRRSTVRETFRDWDDVLTAESPVLVQRGPLDNGLALVDASAALGPTLVVTPTLARARELAAHVRRLRLTVAVLPDEWASAVGGVDVVIGARSAVWAPINDLACIVVLDEHDDALQEERSPTWHARDVAVERARRAGIRCHLLSPLPSVAAFAHARSRSWETQRAWPSIEVVDRSQDEQWSRSLVSSRLVEIVRDQSLRVVVIHNAKGRSQLLACTQCRQLVTCEQCEGAMVLGDDNALFCRRCSNRRPAVCAHCGSSSMANLRPGVGRLVDDLNKASGRSSADVCVVTGASSVVDQRCSLFVGTEAALHRVEQPDVVVFADIDQELRAPRFRASEITASLLVTAARRAGDGRVVVQTHSPNHPLLRALLTGEVESYVQAEASTRQAFGLPPFGALARVSGTGYFHVGEELARNMLVNVSMTEGECLVKSSSTETLYEAFQSIDMPKGFRISVQVDPPRV